MNDCQPKCDSCVDAYNSECPCFLSQRKWSVHDKPKKKHRKKYPSMEEFEFGV